MMKIEEYLKASPLFTLFQAQQAVNQELQKKLLGEEVNFLQGLTLITILLEGHRAITPSQLAKSFNCSKARLSQMLTYLESKGWLHRTITLKDARCHCLTLSSAGMAKANRLMKCLDGVEQAIEERMKGSSAVSVLTTHLLELRAAVAAPTTHHPPPSLPHSERLP